MTNGEVKDTYVKLKMNGKVSAGYHYVSNLHIYVWYASNGSRVLKNYNFNWTLKSNLARLEFGVVYQKVLSCMEFRAIWISDPEWLRK